MSFPCIPVIHTLTLQHRIQENESLSLRPHDGSPLLEREEKASAYLLHYYINFLKQLKLMGLQYVVAKRIFGFDKDKNSKVM